MIPIAFASVGVSGLGLSLLFDGPLSPTKVGTLGEWMAAFGTVLAVQVALNARRDGERLAQYVSQVAERTRIRQRDEAAAERAVRAIFDCHIDTDDYGSVRTDALARMSDQISIEMHIVSDNVVHDRMSVTALVTSLCLAAQARDPEGHPARLHIVRFLVLSLRVQLYSFWRGDPLPPWDWNVSAFEVDADDPQFVWPETIDDAIVFLDALPGWTRLN